MIKGLFDIEFRLEDLTKNGDPLVRLNECVKWEVFRPELETIREELGRAGLAYNIHRLGRCMPVMG